MYSQERTIEIKATSQYFMLNNAQEELRIRTCGRHVFHTPASGLSLRRHTLKTCACARHYQRAQYRGRGGAIVTNDVNICTAKGTCIHYWRMNSVCYYTPFSSKLMQLDSKISASFREIERFIERNSRISRRICCYRCLFEKRVNCLIELLLSLLFLL